MNRKVESRFFLDVLTFRDGNIRCNKTFDKREHLPFSRIDQKKYPYPLSFLSIRSKFGIVTSRISCVGRVKIRKKHSIERSRIYIREFYDRGYSLKAIRNFVEYFFKRNPLQFIVKGLWSNILWNISWSMYLYIYMRACMYICMYARTYVYIFMKME